MEYNRNQSLRQEGSFDTTSKNGGSLFSGRTGSRRKKDPIDEAMLLSKATSQAMIAARSIVLSGGSQQTALSTAKAAAQSILAPHISDNDSVVTAGQTFLGRRKGKRQAEIVASMALLSVNNSLQQYKRDGAPSQQWDASMLVQTPPAQVAPMQQDMDMSMDDESLTVASLLAERQESFRKMSLGLKYQQHMQRESSGMPTSYRESAGRDQSGVRRPSPSKGGDGSRRTSPSKGGDGSRRTSPSKGDDTRLIESPLGKGRSAVPEKNPSERACVKEVAAEPIYTSNVPERKNKRIPVPLSYSTSGEDDSMTAEDFETASWNAGGTNPLAGGKRPDRGFLQQNVDPLLFSITSAFNCGFSPSSTIAAAKDEKKGRRRFNDDDDEDSDDDINETRDDKHKKEDVTDVIMFRRTVESESSVESAQIIRDLNVETDSTNEREDHYTRIKEKHRNAAQKDNARKIAAALSVEDVVLRALSVRDNKKIPPKQTIKNTRNDPIARSRNDRNDEIFAGVHSNPERSSLRVVTGAPVEEDYPASEKPVQSRKNVFHKFIRNRTRRGRGAETAE
jgi:hypothetical protein